MAYESSPKAQARASFLLEKNKKIGLDADETAEMECYMTVEDIVRLAKVNTA